MKTIGKIYIQTDSGNGEWRTISTTIDTSLSVLNQLKRAAKIHPDQPIRAVDENGKVVSLIDEKSLV